MNSNKQEREWKLDVKRACERRGIKNPYQLWQRIGGSKQTTAQLFAGDTKMIRLDTINKLYETLQILPVELFTLEETE